MYFDSFKDAQCGLGIEAVIVMDKYTDIVRAIARFSSLYSPVALSRGAWMSNMMNRMVEGRAQKLEIDMLPEITKQVEGCTIRASGDAAGGLFRV